MTRFLVTLGSAAALLAALGLRFALPAGIWGPGAGVGVPVAQAQTAPEPAQTIVVVGEGEASGTPDVAILMLSVQNEARTAREAIDQNSEAMQQVVDALRRLGIADRHLQTSGVSLTPVRARPQPNDTQPPPITGYQAANALTARAEPAAKAGEAIDAAIGAGANAAGGLRFAVTDDADLQRRALDAAVKSARAKAEAIAAAAGLRIVGVRTMSDEGGQGVPVVPAEAQALAAAARSAPVQPGELTLRTRVRVVYAFG